VPLTVSRAATSTSTGKDLECIMSAVDLAAPSLHSHQSNLEATLLGSPAQRQCEKGNISGIFRHCQVERASSAGIFVFYANLWPRRVSSSLSDFFFLHLLVISAERHLNEADLAQTFPLLFWLMIYKPRVITTALFQEPKAQLNVYIHGHVPCSGG